MNPKMLILLVIIPATSGFVDCRAACRTCRERKAEQSLLEVHCAMCEECKQRRRERLQMNSRQMGKRQQQGKQATRAQARAQIQHLQPNYPEGCPTPEPCPRSQEEYHPGHLQVSTDGKTCPPVDQCATKGQLQYMKSIVTMQQPPVVQPSMPSQPAPIPVPLPGPMPVPLPPPIPLPFPMAPPMPPMHHIGVQNMPTVAIEPTHQAQVPTLSSTQYPLQPAPMPSLDPLAPQPPPLPPPLHHPPPMFYPPYYPGCYCMPFMGPACHCPPFKERPAPATHPEIPFTTERDTFSTKEYLYAYVGVPREILKY